MLGLANWLLAAPKTQFTLLDLLKLIEICKPTELFESSKYFILKYNIT